MFVSVFVFDGASVQEYSLCAPELEARLVSAMSRILAEPDKHSPLPVETQCPLPGEAVPGKHPPWPPISPANPNPGYTRPECSPTRTGGGLSPG